MDERADAVQRLIDDSARGVVDVTVLSALELCALGATGQDLFDTSVAAAWGALADDARAMAQSEFLAGLVRRELVEPAGEMVPAYPHLARMGPLGWFYRYTLASTEIAANLLVRWTELTLPRNAKGRVITSLVTVP
jgi:hypothetical protein